MRVELKKQPVKYLDKCSKGDYEKLCNAIYGLEDLCGDIKKLRGYEDEYRLKVPPYRVVFTYNSSDKVITVQRIGTRGDVYKKG